MPEQLSDREKELLKGLIDRGEPLPPKYKASLFAEAPTTELIWPGKRAEVESVVLPFQSVEQIDEPRGRVSGEISLFEAGPSGRQSSGWTNKLIWGDNRLALSSLANGPLRNQIEDTGGLKLVYIDPPFDVGADFSFDVEVGESDVEKTPSVIEEIAYRDTWGSGRDSFASMMYERLLLMHQLMATNSSIFVHCDWRVNSLLRLVLDEIFGSDGFRNEIVWHYFGFKRSTATFFPRKHDTILFYVKGEPTWNVRYREHRPEYVARFKTDEEGRRYRDDVNPTGGGTRVIYLDEVEGDIVDSVWDDIPPVNPQAKERTGYATQKPEALIERLVTSATKPGDLVADFFSESGTTLAVAERLTRRWVGCDLSRYAIHTSRKRLIQVQRQLKAEGQPYRSFEILNLGKYERQYFVGVDPNASEDERLAESAAREGEYLDLICRAYSAKRLAQSPPFHARKGQALVLIGPVDAPVTRTVVEAVVAAALDAGSTQVDVLGFEFEMGLSPAIKDEASKQGVQLSLKYIPNDVFDKRAIAKNDVQFYDVAYVEVRPKVAKRSVAVSLTDFGVFYRQEDLDAVAESLGRGKTRVLIDQGMIVKLTNDGGVTKTEVLTKDWSDWIDYWAVDFDFESRKELIRVVDDGEERQVWSGRYIFENLWQSFRTRQNRSLELTTAPHEYDEPGTYRVAVKVIDIFGNDTTKVIDVEVK